MFYTSYREAASECTEEGTKCTSCSEYIFCTKNGETFQSSKITCGADQVFIVILVTLIIKIRYTMSS